MRGSLVAAFSMLFVAACAVATRAATSDDLRVLPRPSSIAVDASCSLKRSGGLTVLRDADSGAREIVDERWRALGIPVLHLVDRGADVALRHFAGRPQSYRLAIDRRSVVIDSADADGAFYAFATLAQLGHRESGGLSLPCVRISDAPALRWRILSDDVSRGPLPTMRYFRERIRTIAAFKMNGYSPYMEHVFVDPKHPLPAPPDGISVQQLRELNAYARRLHVALVPEQQTFAHMHNTLRWEEYAPLAELPHGYLLSPANPAGASYARDLIEEELRAVPHPPFFHIGSDEPSDLGRGAAKALVAERGASDVFAQHVLDTIALVAPSGARPMIWDDAVQAHPEIFARLPKVLVFVNWHYGVEPTFMPYIERIAHAGFDQMVAPGADNWNEIYPDLDAALTSIDRFVGEGKSARVLGLFQTVWHDDGETLYEATWYPLLYAAASAWESGTVERDRFARDFPGAFFGTDERGYADSMRALGEARTLLRAAGDESAGDYLFWADPFDPALLARMRRVDLAALRLAVEPVIAQARVHAPPPLHANAAAVMALAARRYDALARAYQIATEARAYYDDARANAGGVHDDYVYRGLNVAKYSLWEMRDDLLALEPLVRAAWEYESRPAHEASVLERYHMAAQRAIARADALNRTTLEVYQRTHTLPSFDEVVPAPKAP